MTAALGIIGLGLNFVSGAFSAISQSQAASYQAAIAKRNQEIAQGNAVRSVQTAQVEQQDRDNVARALLGEQVAEQSASGFTLGSGSFRRARRSAQELARQDALRIRQAGDVDAFNYKVQAANYGAEAKLASMTASSSLLGGFLGAGASLVSGANKIFVPQASY